MECLEATSGSVTLRMNWGELEALVRGLDPERREDEAAAALRSAASRDCQPKSREDAAYVSMGWLARVLACVGSWPTSEVAASAATQALHEALAWIEARRPPA